MSTRFYHFKLLDFLFFHNDFLMFITFFFSLPFILHSPERGIVYVIVRELVYNKAKVIFFHIMFFRNNRESME